MADLVGFGGKLAVSAAGSSYTDVGGVLSASISTAHGKVDVSDWDSAGWKENLVGYAELTLSFEHNYDEADAGQDIIRTAVQGRTQLYFRLRAGGDASGVGDEIIGLFLIDSYDSPNNPNEGAVTSSGTASSTGTPTFQQQP
ncbi:MAG: phage tail tube protein [Candidatus Hodarchaeales archaeon]|jgi:predicted secreted protein